MEVDRMTLDDFAEDLDLRGFSKVARDNTVWAVKRYLKWASLEGIEPQKGRKEDVLSYLAYLCQWRSRNAQLWRNRSAQAYKYLPLFQLNLKPTLSAILGYQTLLSAFFEPVAIAFDIDGNAVV
jgi:hypothetical protein